MFKKLDTDNSGTLSKAELLEGYKIYYNELDADREVDEIFAKADIDGSGKIDFTEFITATMDIKQLLTCEKIE